MFKIESYITPILLSYIDKYVENFKPEDSQVSLWSGGVSLYNLHLRTDIIQRDFNLPFRFVSGYIYELLIQVPWMKIVSDPIVVTINTIECILTLDRYPEFSATSIQTQEDGDVPPGYMQSLINKIVGNIAVRCNNFILKYVEGDIVVSLNIRHLSFDSTNANWESAFTEVTENDLNLRKLIQLNDLTFCVDESNAAGKIETYQEPLLFRCELCFRVLNMYRSVKSKRPYCTRLTISTSCLDFNISSQQIPIIMRLSALILALQMNELKIEKRKLHPSTAAFELTGENATDDQEAMESWTGWLWSFVPALPSSYALDDDGELLKNKFLMILCGVYIEKLSFTFKVPQYTTDVMHFHGGHKKNRFLAMCTLTLTSVKSELALPGYGNTCFRFGIEEILLNGGSHCTCGILDSLNPAYYISSKNSLENQDLNKWPLVELENFENTPKMTSEEMLAICPALAVELMCHSTKDSENEDKYFEGDKMVQIAVGPLHVVICPSFTHRIQSVLSASEKYDYAPYIDPLPDLEFHELPPPTTDDYDLLVSNVPLAKYFLSATKLQISFNVWEHKDELKKSTSFSALPSKKTSNMTDENFGKGYIPVFVIECTNVDLYYEAPLNPRILVHTTCQLPQPEFIDACFTKYLAYLRNIQCFLLFISKDSLMKNEIESKSSPFIRQALTTQFSIESSLSKIIEEKYWLKHPNLSYLDFELMTSNLSICGTAPRFITATYVLSNIYQQRVDDPNKSILGTTSLIKDCLHDKNIVHLDIAFDDTKATLIRQLNVDKYSLSCEGVKVFAWDPVKRAKVEQVWILSAPEGVTVKSDSFLQMALQISRKNSNVASYIGMKMEPFSFNMDPLLWQLLTYSPTVFDTKVISANASNTNKPIQQRKSADELVKPFSKRIVDQKAHSLGHTSSDRDKEYVHGSSSLQQNVMSPLVDPESKKSDSVDKPWLQEYLMYNFTNFQHIQIMCDIASSTFYFPLGPVSALNSRSLHESMDTYVSNHKGTTFNLLNLGFPAITLQSASIQSDVMRTFAQPKFITVLNEPEISSFPWKVTFSNLSCFMKKPVGTQSVQQFEVLPLLKPFNFNATIGVTAKTHKRNDESYDIAPEIVKDTQESGKQKKRKTQNLPSSKEDPKDEQENNNELLSSLATYVHVDMGALSFAFNQNQIAFITYLLHAVNDLTTYLLSFDKTTTAETCITKSYSKLLDDIMDTRASSDPIISSAPVTTFRSEEASCSSTSEHMGHNDSLIDKESSATIKSTVATDSGLFSVSSWIQWTVPKIRVKLYVEMKNKDKSQTCHKIQFTAEDIVMSLDIEPEYLKLKSKIVTADLFHFQRSDCTNKWALGDFNGLVIRGREKESSKDENNFLSLTFTKAKYTSLQNRWLDNFKKSKQFKRNETSDHTYVSEVVVSLQPLDILASVSVVELFSSVFLRSTTPIPCLKRSEEIKISNDRATLNSVLMDNSPSVLSAELWDSHNFPLIYLESSDIKIILPNTNFEELPEVLLFEIGSIKLTPHADNPICRQPLRPDLYQRAARTHLTDIPGSELEDRQYQISIKNIAIRTTMWTDLNDYEVKNSLNINENPAFVWNNLIETNTNSSTMTICQHVELCFVLALAMSYHNELVCGPAIEINIVSDINILLSTSQFLLFRCHMEKFKEIQDKLNRVAIETQAAPSCCYSLYLYNADQKCYKSIDFRRNSYIDKPSSVLQSEISSNAYRSCALTLDSGVESDHISAIKTDSEFSRIAPKLYRKSPRLPAIHFDLYFAAGKLMINVFHQLTALGRKAKRKPDNIDIQNRRPSSKDGFIMHREFQAYSKDNTNEESSSSVQMSYRPLIYFEMTQPNMFVSKHNFQSKLQISLFHAYIGLGEEKYMPHIPTIKDYNLTVFESKKGVINEVTGIPPALLTLKWIRCVGKSDIVTIDVDRPSNFTISIDYLSILNSIQALITPDIDDTQMAEENLQKDFSSPNKENSAILWHIKSILTEFQVVKLKMTQLVLTCYPSKSKDIQMKLSVSSLQNSLTNSLRPESISQTVLVESAMITFQKLKESCIIMRPWTFGLELAVCWETWQYFDGVNSPIIRLSGEADKLSLDVGPEQISAIKILLKKWKEYVTDLVKDNMELNHKLSLSNDSSASLNSPEVAFNPHILQEQHYKDDLRAGAFQFVEESSLPQAYQVTMSPDRLCWRYPQPRAIARIHSFPIPFKVDHNKDAKCISSVPCVLEYYSDITKTFEELISFELKEEQHVKLDLNIVPPKVIFATLWSVRMLSDRAGEQSNKEEYFDRNKYLKTEYMGLTPNLDREKEEETNFPVKSSMLAACLRVDSYFEPKLIPKFQLGFEFKSIELNLFTPKIERLVSPPHVANYSPQNFVPDSNIFLTMLLESSIIRLQKFDINALVMGIESNLSVSMLDSRYFLMYPVMKKCPFQVDFSVKMPAPLKNVQLTDVDVRIGDLTLDISPSVVHTTLISLIALSDNLLEETSSHYDKYLWSMKKKYLICNDTTQTLLLSQKNSTESVILDPKCCIPYSWYDHSLPLSLCIGNEDGDWQLSQIEAINLDLIGTTQYNLDPVNYGAEGSVVVTVEQINTGQNKVTIMGQLIMWNMVSEEILLKITYEDTGGNGRLSRTVLLKENSKAPSMIIPYSSEKFLKVKFTNRDSGISGDIPVTECPKENVPWLVKIPMLNNKNDFISIWCRVVCDKESKRICISLWPLYILKSHLPMGKEVIVATEEFNQSSTCYLPGKGLCSALLCHGTMKTKHSLIFDKSENSGGSNRVSLHYGNVVQTKFFNETNVKCNNMDVLLTAFDEWLNEKKSSWPYSCVQSLCAGEWLPADEYPNTHITVNFESGGPHISSLLVEICPWGLMVNTSDLFISFNIPNGREICSAQPGTVAMTGAGFTNENFVVSILDDNGELCISDTISVKDSEIGIYEAKKPGSLHVENHCQLSIPSPIKVCYLTLYYEMKENINVFGAASTYLMMNHLDIEVNVAFVAVALSEESKTKFHSYPEIFRKISPSQNKTQEATPISFFYYQWNESSLDYYSLKNCALYVVIFINNIESHTCPVRIDTLTHRRGIALEIDNKSEALVLTCQEYRGQTIISIHKDEKPQLIIRNDSDLELIIGSALKKPVQQSYVDETYSPSEVCDECEHFDWKCIVKPKRYIYYSSPSYSENYPNISKEDSSQTMQNRSNISIAYYCENNQPCVHWTAPVDISTNITEQFVKLPNLNKDLKVTVECHAHTTLVTIKNVSQIDISASVIRQRLSDNVPMARNSSITSLNPQHQHIHESKTKEMDIIPRDHSSGSQLLRAKAETNISFSIIVDHINFLMRSGSKMSEKIGALYIDYLAVDGKPKVEGMTIIASLLEMQFDNTLHTQGHYDFPVLIVRQNPTSLSLPWPSLWSIQNHQPILTQVRQSYFVKITMHFDHWVPMHESICAPMDIIIETNPISLYFEDTYISTVLDYFSDMIIFTYPSTASDVSNTWSIKIPSALIAESSSIAKPLVLKNITIRPLSLSLSMHTSVRLYLALDHSPLNFETFQRNNLMTSSYRLGTDLAMHYLSGAIVGAGWVVGSLEILGSPGGLVRRVGSGLRDLVLEPWNGLAYGPQAFLAGAAYGSYSLARHLTQGAVQSVSMVCGSVARNLDLLSLDQDHVRRASVQRRRRPVGVLDALSRGFSGLAVSLLGAVGGIAHHPIVAPTEGNGTTMATGITRGLLGVVTKPLSATADLVALAGQGFLSQAGWDNQPQLRLLSTNTAEEYDTCTPSNARLRFLRFSPDMAPLYAGYSHMIYPSCVETHVMLIITYKWLLILEKDKVRMSVDLNTCHIHEKNTTGNTVELIVKETGNSSSLDNAATTSNAADQNKEYPENDVEMMSAIKERVARYIGGLAETSTSNADCITLLFQDYQAGFFRDMIIFAKREHKQEGFSLL